MGGVFQKIFGELNRAPNAVVFLHLHRGLRPALANGLADLAGKGRLTTQYAAGQHKVNGLIFLCQFACAVHGVLGQHAGGTFENIAGDSVPFLGGREDFWGDGGDGVLVRSGHPIDQIIGFIGAGGREQAFAQSAPRAIAVKVKHHRFQGAQADFKTAPFIAKDMTPPAHLGRASVRRFAETTRAGSGQH